MADNSQQFVKQDWPFPHWTMTTVLPSWVGHPIRGDLYGWREEPRTSDGEVEIQLAPVRESPDAPSQVEIAATLWVIENEAAISQALLASLFQEYRNLQDLYGYTGEERLKLMPDVNSPEELLSLIRLNTLYIHRNQKDGVPYSGFGFGCTWEEEHALGILMHGTRTVKIGWADTAFDRVRDDHDSSASDSLIVAPRRIRGWPPASRREGWIDSSGEPLCGPDEDQFYKGAGAQFSIVGPLISEAQIRAVFPESFPGKEDLVQFYLRYNGGSRSPKGCIMHCAAAAHRVPRSELGRLNVEGFQSIPINPEDRMLPFANMLLRHAAMARIYSQIPEMRAFLDEHIGIALDHSGRDLCISRRTGRIFFIDWDEYKEGPLEIAASFREFVQRYWNTHHGPVH